MRDSIAVVEHDEALTLQFATKNLALGGEHTVDRTLSTLFSGTKYVRTLICLQVRFISDCLRHMLDLSIGSDNGKVSGGSSSPSTSPGGTTKKSFRTGIIGCGRIGSAIAHALINESEVAPNSIMIGTRQNDTTAAIALHARGVTICSNNPEATQRSRLIIICCLPAQMREVARSLAGTIRRTSVVLSCVPGFSPTKIAHMLKLESDQMVLRIGVQAPVNAVANALQKYADPETGRLDSRILCQFAGQALIPRTGDLERLRGMLEKYVDFVRPSPIMDENGRPHLLVQGFSTRAMVNQALYGSHIDPGAGELEAKKEGAEQKAEDIRKESLAAWVSVCLSRDDGGFEHK